MVSANQSTQNGGEVKDSGSIDLFSNMIYYSPIDVKE